MSGSNDNLRGALWMIGSMAAFTLNDALMKNAGADLPLAQAVFLRGVGGTILLAILAWRLKGLHFRFPAKDWKLKMQPL